MEGIQRPGMSEGLLGGAGGREGGAGRALESTGRGSQLCDGYSVQRVFNLRYYSLLSAKEGQG